MTESPNALSEVPTLLEERRRYESWLVALDGRRESTPQHVFERVQTDYRTRLQRVAERLASFRGAIAEERTNLQSRLSLLEAEEGLRRDERAELELRTHVGELIGVDAESALGTVDQALGQLVGERQGLVERISELGTLLTESANQQAVRNVAGKDTSAQPATVVGARVAAHFEAPAPLRVHPRESHLPQVAPEVRVAVEQSVEPVRPAAAAAVAPKLTPPKPEAAPPPAAAAGVGPTGPSPVPPRPREAGPDFDEVAFLSPVVGKNDGAAHEVGIAQGENAGESLLSGVENARLATGERPLAANVPSNTAFGLRPSTLEQAKSLKCNECGGMNYPTEWYCERCGAELAAL
jgi:hypothetical protein